MGIYVQLKEERNGDTPWKMISVNLSGGSQPCPRKQQLSRGAVRCSPSLGRNFGGCKLGKPHTQQYPKKEGGGGETELKPHPLKTPECRLDSFPRKPT